VGAKLATSQERQVSRHLVKLQPLTGLHGPTLSRDPCQLGGLRMFHFVFAENVLAQ
jgi:hypothetical protein